MILSVLVALTLTPALCGTILKHIEHDEHGRRRVRRGPLGWLDRFFLKFNAGFDRTASGTQGVVLRMVRRGWRMMLVYAALAAGLAFAFGRLPTSFLPIEDQGLLTADICLPSGAADARIQQVARQFEDYVGQQPEVVTYSVTTGLSGDQGTGDAPSSSSSPGRSVPAPSTQPRPSRGAPMRPSPGSATHGCSCSSRRPCAGSARPRASWSTCRTPAA
ncbi:MAG: Multidrug resistance protein MexB [Xylophilus sp.]|nr:MAG: Multidrug resistance protein MexB [Xylophilus sp.]